MKPTNYHGSSFVPKKMLLGRKLFIREIQHDGYVKRETSDSRSRFLKVNDKYTRIVQNNSRAYGKHETTYHH